MPWSWFNTEYSIHQVQHAPSTTGSTIDCLSSFHYHDYELIPECNVGFQCASLYDRPPPARPPWHLKAKVTSSHSHGCKLTNWQTECLKHPARLRWTASKFFSSYAHSYPASASPNSLNHIVGVPLYVNLFHHSLALYIHTRSITASMLAWSSPPSESRNLLNHCLHVHFLTPSNTAF